MGVVAVEGLQAGMEGEKTFSEAITLFGRGSSLSQPVPAWMGQETSVGEADGHRRPLTSSPSPQTSRIDAAAPNSCC